MDLKKRITKEGKLINKGMQSYLTKGQPSKLYDAVGHLPSAGGKRLRPVIVLLSCEAVGGHAQDAIPYGVALELVHTFTLVHDDLMDNDEERRGLPAVHKLFGKDTAILAGDALFAKAFEVATKTPVESSVVIVLIKNISIMAREICEGQQLDMNYEELEEVKEDDFLEMIEKKTAKVFEYAAYGGALIGGGSKEEQEALREYGKALGLAFQIWDDCLDFLGDNTLGKPRGSDIREGKKTLVAIHALSAMGREQKKIFGEIFGNSNASEKDITTVADIFDKTDSITYASSKAAEYVKAAQTALKKIRDSEAKLVLSELAEFSLKRTK